MEGAVAIPLTQGAVAWVDPNDAPALVAHRWHLLQGPSGKGYAARREKAAGRRYILMHREILGLGPGRVPETDHRNGDGLDNRRANLRVADRVGNNRNTPKMRGRSGKKLTSRYKGVSWDKGTSRWRADILVLGRHYFLGRFDDEAEAARVYDAEATKRFGEFARTNGG
jgi:hypothetical protein